MELSPTLTDLDGARLTALPEDHRAAFDRKPFGYRHNLCGLDILSFDVLCDLARKYDRDYFVAGSAPSPGTRFYSVPSGTLLPYEALQRLDSEENRVLLKRPENYDPRYRELMRVLFAQVLEMRGGLAPGEHVVRLDSSILVSSAATITPFHFDPEVSSFFQIEGEKVYHLYAPGALSEAELEQFYWMGIVNIGQVDLAGRDPVHEHVFRLSPGMGMHQPQNSPHWVETVSTRTISYVFSFETNFSRALGRTRAFNYYMRKAGLTPAPPGSRLGLDAGKARLMEFAIPARKAVRGVIERVRGNARRERH
jgi:hypothetical protein